MNSCSLLLLPITAGTSWLAFWVCALFALKVFLLVFALFSKSSMCKKKKNFPSVSILVMHQKQMKPFVFQNSERTGADWIVVPCYFFQLRPVHHDLLSEFVHCLLWKFSCLFLLCFQKVACVKRKKNFRSVRILVMHQKQVKPFVFQSSKSTGADWIVVPCYLFQLRFYFTNYRYIMTCFLSLCIVLLKSFKFSVIYTSF